MCRFVLVGFGPCVLILLLVLPVILPIIDLTFNCLESFVFVWIAIISGFCLAGSLASLHTILKVKHILKHGRIAKAKVLRKDQRTSERRNEENSRTTIDYHCRFWVEYKVENSFREQMAPDDEDVESSASHGVQLNSFWVAGKVIWIPSHGRYQNWVDVKKSEYDATDCFSTIEVLVIPDSPSNVGTVEKLKVDAADSLVTGIILLFFGVVTSIIGFGFAPSIYFSSEICNIESCVSCTKGHVKASYYILGFYPLIVICFMGVLDACCSCSDNEPPSPPPEQEMTPITKKETMDSTVASTCSDSGHEGVDSMERTPLAIEKANGLDL